MKEHWIVFKEKKTGRELCAYTLRGSYKGEARATMELLAAEHNLKPEQIRASVELREKKGGKHDF